MKQQGWQKQPFCKEYIRRYRQALASVFSDLVPAASATGALGQEDLLEEAFGYEKPRMHEDHAEHRRQQAPACAQCRKGSARRTASEERKHEKKRKQHGAEKARCTK